MHSCIVYLIILLNRLFVVFLQNVLSDIPKLKHIIYVDQKIVSTEGYPAGITMNSMQAVRELGARPENREYLAQGLNLLCGFFHITRDTDYSYPNNMGLCVLGMKNGERIIDYSGSPTESEMNT